MLRPITIVSIGALAILLSGHARATCLNRENTAVPESTPTSNYTVLPDGTLVAPAAGLMWKRCLEGQTLNVNICEGTPTLYMWVDALVAAHASTFAGHSDWRLPNPKELLSIFDDKCADPSLNADLFPIPESFGAWTATPTALHLLPLFDGAWLLTSDGALWFKSQYTSVKVLLVRDLP